MLQFRTVKFYMCLGETPFDKCCRFRGRTAALTSVVSGECSRDSDKAEVTELKEIKLSVKCCKVVGSKVLVSQDQFKTKIPFEHYVLFD